MPWTEAGYSPWVDDPEASGTYCETCGGEGEVDCNLCCNLDDPDRGDPCIDCGNTYAVRCDDCGGFGTWDAVVAAGYGG